MEASKALSVQETNSSASEYEQSFHANLANSILPILDNLSQLYLPFQSFEIIQIIFCILQFFQTSFWIEYGQYWKQTSFPNLLHYLTFFASNNQDQKENIILFCIFFILVLIIFALFGTLILHYHKTRRIYRPLLYIVRTYFMFFSIAILHPISSLTGHILNNLIEYKKASDAVMLFFIVITFILAEILVYIHQRFVNEGIYLHKSLFFTFDSKLLVFLFIWNPIFLLLDHLFKYYPIWAYYILIFFHVFSIIIYFSNYLWVPFVEEIGNVLPISILSTMIFIDIFRIFAEIYRIKKEIFISISYSIFITFSIVTYIIIEFFRKRINKNLMYSTLIDKNPENCDLSDELKYNYFSELKLDSNLQKAMIYLIVGFTKSSEFFVDFSLPHFCYDNYKESVPMIILLTHLLSYFKSQKKFFDQVLKQIHVFNESSFFGHFILYQAHKVRIYRQFTPTNFSSTRLNELKNLSSNLEGQIKAFWLLKSANKNTISQIEQQQRSLLNFWIESIEYNFLSTSFHEEYIRFLTESCTDFQKAIIMNNIKEKIDSFKGDRDDLCYLSLISCFPKYINKDGSSFSLKKSDKSHSNASTTMSSNYERYSSTSNEYDFTQDEQVANSLLSYGRLRLSMQSALSYCKPTFGKIFLFYTIFVIIVSSVCLIVFFSIYINRFDNFNNWDEEVGVLIALRLGYVRSIFCLSVFYGQKNNRFGISPIDCEFMNEQNRNFLELKSDFSHLAEGYANETEYQFSNLIEVLIGLSLRDVNTTALTSILFDPNIKSNVCYYGEIVDHLNWSMEQILNFEVLSALVLADDSNKTVLNWHNNTYWCHITSNFADVTSNFIDIQNSLVDDLYESSMKTSKSIVIQMEILGPCNLLIFIIPFPLILVYYSKEIDHLIKMILATDDEYKEQARNKILLKHLSETQDLIPPMTMNSFNYVFIIYSLICILSLLIFIVFVLMILFYAKLMSDKLRNFGIWSCNFSFLRSYLMELIIEMINEVYNLPFYEYRDHIYDVIHSFEIIIYNVLNDVQKNPSAVGVDSIIDQIVLSSPCENPQTYQSLHDTYKCGSLVHIVTTAHSLLVKICEEIESYDGIFVGEEVENLYHLIFAHAITDLINVGERYESLQDEEISRYKINLVIFFLCGIAFIIICLIFMMLINTNFQRVFDMSLSLIRRLPPVGFITNGELTNYLLFKKGEEVEMGVTHAIFNNSFDGIICLNNDGVIEIFNKSFASDYGYSPEQLVGQQIGIIFDDNSRVVFENQLKLMKNHESRDYVDSVICLSSDGRRIQTHITLFGTKGNESNFILVVRDETLLLEKKKRVEMAKKQSQDLLEQIVPSKVLMMMKEGKSEISFTVPSATVMFFDIVNFSSYSSSLSPQQIMGTLSSLFGAFDVWIQKYPLMTKIKLIGDIYMAACGLFAADAEPKVHAKQGIDFSLRVLNILDDTNIKLNVSLQIRIGINTDGPIIAGVLGTENRVFDIIGDTINGASRLEHKAKPGHILMSEKTYELVKEFDFNIKPVGEVYLKGKGFMNAYTI